MGSPRRTSRELSRLAEKRLDKLVAAAKKLPSLRKMGPKMGWNVSVELIGSARMRSLNREYRQKDYATDILSFVAMPMFREQQGYLGELVICNDVLKRQAKEQGHSELFELDVLLTHGLLHLLGMDHEVSEKEARRMASAEEKLLSAIRSSRQGLVERNGGV